MEMQSIKGKFNGFSGGVTLSSGANRHTKAISMHELDYIAVDDLRIKNIIVSNSVHASLNMYEGQEVTIHYVENEVHNSKKRLISGFDKPDGSIESIMVDDIKPTANAIVAKGNILMGISVFMWLIFGGGASVLMGAPGALVFISGLGLIIWGLNKKKVKESAPLNLVLSFAENHDKSI